MASELPDIAAEEGWDEDPEVLGPRRRSRIAGLLFALVALLVVTAMLLAMVPSARDAPGSDLVAGVVSTVSADGSSFCMILDASGRTLCPDLFRATATGPLVVGQHVTGVLILIEGASPQVPVFVMHEPPSSP